MESFEEEQKRCISAFDGYETLIRQLKTVNEAKDKYPDEDEGDYNHFGCEFILNGFNTKSRSFSLFDFIEDECSEACGSRFDFSKESSFLFFSPRDIRRFVFDFSSLFEDNKVKCYDGITPLNYQVVREFSIEDFLNEYGVRRFFSLSHWNKHWII